MITIELGSKDPSVFLNGRLLNGLPAIDTIRLVALLVAEDIEVEDESPDQPA